MSAISRIGKTLSAVGRLERTHSLSALLRCPRGQEIRSSLLQLFFPKRHARGILFALLVLARESSLRVSPLKDIPMLTLFFLQ